MSRIRAAFLASCVCVVVAQAGLPPLVIPDRGSRRIMLLSGDDGSLIDPNWLTEPAEAPFSFTNLTEACVVGNQLWVSGNFGITRFDLQRNYLGRINHFENGQNIGLVRGLGFDGTSAYAFAFNSTALSRQGLLRLDQNGAQIGFTQMNDSMFDVAPFQGGLLMSDWTNDNIERRLTDGTPVGTFVAGVPNTGQVVVREDGTVLAAVARADAGVEGVYLFAEDGSELAFIDTQELESQQEELLPLGTWLLGDGGYLISTSAGLYKAVKGADGYDFTLVLGAGVVPWYINAVPGPGTLTLLLGMGMVGVGRRRS